MKRTKFTDFVLSHLKWTGVFLYDYIRYYRLRLAMYELYKCEGDRRALLKANDDVITTCERDEFEIRGVLTEVGDSDS